MKAAIVMGLVLAAAASAFCQQPNTTKSSFTINDVDGPPFPISSSVESGSLAALLVSGSPNVPFVLFQSATGLLQPGAATLFGDKIDVPLSPFPGILADGFAPGSPFHTNALGSWGATVPTPPVPGATAALQVFIVDPTSIFGFSLTAATGVTITQVATSTSLSLGDEGVQAVSLGTMTVPFYGVDRSAIHVCANGYLTFAPTPSDFVPSATQFVALPPRIAPLWTDIVCPAGGVIVTTAPATTSGPGFVKVTYNALSWASPFTHTFTAQVTTNGVVVIAIDPSTAMPLYDSITGIGPGMSLGLPQTQKDLSALSAPNSYSGNVNESFFEWHGIVALHPYYGNPYDNPFDLIGKTLTFVPTGVGTLPFSTNRYLMY